MTRAVGAWSLYGVGYLVGSLVKGGGWIVTAIRIGWTDGRR